MNSDFKNNTKSLLYCKVIRK